MILILSKSLSGWDSASTLVDDNASQSSPKSWVRSAADPCVVCNQRLNCLQNSMVPFHSSGFLGLYGLIVALILNTRASDAPAVSLLLPFLKSRESVVDIQ